MGLYLIARVLVSMMLLALTPTRGIRNPKLKTLLHRPLSASSSQAVPAAAFNQHTHFMRLALRHAQHAFREKEVPIGDNKLCYLGILYLCVTHF